MKKNIMKVNPEYVGDNCCLVMLPTDSITSVIGREGILYTREGDNTINAYLNDPRRRLFPHSKYPIHLQKKGLFGKQEYMNQFFDFGNPYLLFGYNNVTANVLVKHKYDTYLVSGLPREAAFSPEKRIVTRNELLSMLSRKGGEETFIINWEGGQFKNFDIPETDVVLKRYIDDLRKQAEYLSSPETNLSFDDDASSTFAGCNYLIAERKLREAESLEKGANYSIPVFGSCFASNNSCIYLVRITFDNVILEKYDISVVGENQYSVICNYYVLDGLTRNFSKLLKDSKVVNQPKAKIYTK